MSFEVYREQQIDCVGQLNFEVSTDPDITTNLESTTVEDGDQITFTFEGDGPLSASEEQALDDLLADFECDDDPEDDVRSSVLGDVLNDGTSLAQNSVSKLNYVRGISAELASDFPLNPQVNINVNEPEIDHTQLQNVGSNSHSDIDTHISDRDVHYGDAPADSELYVRKNNEWFKAPVTAVGGIALEYEWTDNTNESDPGDGRVKVNNRIQTQATALYVSSETENENDVSVIWDAFQGGDIVGIYEKDDDEGVYYTLTSDPVPRDGGDWYSMGVEVFANGNDQGGIDDEEEVIIVGIQNPNSRLPRGGEEGDALFKKSDGDYDTEFRQILDTDIESTGATPNTFLLNASNFENPINSNWAVNSLAPAIADPTNSALTVRAFDDSTSEGIGFLLTTPSVSSSYKLSFRSRPRTAKGSTGSVSLELYTRPVPDGEAVPAWESTGKFSVTTSSDQSFTYQDVTFNFSDTNITAGTATQFELVRVSGGSLSGDWLLVQLIVEFS